MGERIEFPSNGERRSGYLAIPAGGAEGTIGVLVIQEWWGLVDQITRTCDRFAEAGFTALAPDLYHGTAVPLTEPDEAAKQMMALKMGEAATELSGAVDELLRRTGRPSVGVVGFCMGGGLALVLASQRPDAVAAVVPAYGVIPWPDARPDYASMQAVVEGHVAELDGSFSPAAADDLVTELTGLGKTASFHLYPGVDHAFFNEDRPEVYDADAAGAAVGAHRGVPAVPARLIGSRDRRARDRTGRGLPDARAPPGPPHRRHGGRLLRPTRAGPGRRGRAGGPAETARWPRPAPCWPISRPAGPSIRRPGRRTRRRRPVGTGSPPRCAAWPPPAPSWPASRSATPTRWRPATACGRAGSTRRRWSRPTGGSTRCSPVTGRWWTGW